MTIDKPDDFMSLDDLVGDALVHRTKAMQKPSTKRALVQQHNARVHAELDGEFDDLNQILEQAMDKREWIPAALVCIIHLQECTNCRGVSSWCDGWYTRYNHRTDKHATKTTQGRLQEGLPQQVERNVAKAVDICAECAESQIIIEEAFSRALQ